MSTRPTDPKRPQIVRVSRATVSRQRGWAVTWGEPRSRFKQTLYLPTAEQAAILADGLRAGDEAVPLILRAWGRPLALTRSDLGRLGGPARAAAMTPEQRRESSRKALDARWAKVRAAKAAEAAAKQIDAGGTDGG